MEKQLTYLVSRSILAFAFVFTAVVSNGQSSSKDKELLADSKDAIADFKKTDASLGSTFSSAYGYVVFPNVGKGAVVVGGASGGGILYEKGTPIGKAQMTQVTVGFQAGGQAYRELVFFENKATFDRFKENNFEFSAQVSAIAATAGVAAKSKYSDGVMIFTQQKGGLMYEASVGGQKFKYTAW